MEQMPIMRFLGIVHGAAIAALIDHAGGYGARALTGRGGPTSDLHIRYLGAAKEGSVLRAESRVERAGRSRVRGTQRRFARRRQPQPGAE